MDKSVIISGDALDVVKRINAIDRGYYVKYNLSKCRYEVHHNRNSGNTLAAVLPYNNLDCRAVNYIKETRIERLNIIAREIEQSNERLEQYKERHILDEADYKARQLAGFISRGGSDLPSYNDI